MNKKNNQIPEQKAWSIILIIQRILAFPFFAAYAFIAAICLWFAWIWNFGKYGGEAIAYTNKTTKQTIQDVFQKGMEKQDKHIFQKGMEKQDKQLHNVSNSIAIEYAKFCVSCDRAKLPLLQLEDYIKQYCC